MPSDPVSPLISTFDGRRKVVSIQVSIGVRFDAKVRKNHPGRQAAFLRKLRHFNGIGTFWERFGNRRSPVQIPAPRSMKN